MTKHTLGPWEITRGKSPGGEIFLLSPIGRGPGRSRILASLDGLNAEANAEFIVRACNAHKKLLEACKEALKRFRLYEMHVDDEPPHHHSSFVVKLESLVAKAEEGQP